MPMDQLPKFLAELRRHESNNRYEHIAEDGERLGAYGISPRNWARWTDQVGLSGAPWQSKAAQDMVAREKARELYGRYGDWTLVALAWWGGTQYADSLATADILPEDAEFADEALQLTRSLGPARGRGVKAIASQQAPTDTDAAGPETQPDTQLTKALKKAGHLPRAELSARGSKMHSMMAPILQGISNSIRNAPEDEAAPAAREEGIPTNEAPEYGGAE